MLTPYSQPSFVSKIVADAFGRQFRLTFLVALVNGELKGRLVSAEPLSQSVARLSGTVSEVSNGMFCLPIAVTDKKPATEYAFDFTSLVSPYFSVEFLIKTQPTRAPSRA